MGFHDLQRKRFKMRILITGAAGFMGYHLSKSLSSKFSNSEFILVDNFARGIRDADFSKLILHDNIIFHEIDLNKSDLSPLPKVFDYVFHFAAINGTQNFYKVPFKTIVASSIPTYNLLQYLDLKSIKNFVFASTSEIYAGAVESNLITIPTTEDIKIYLPDLKNLRWSYAIGKLYSEQLVNYAGIETGLKYTILRIHNIYGTRMGDNHVIPDLFEKFMKNNFEVYGAEQTRSFCHINDAIAQIQSLVIGGHGENQIFNIGSSNEILIRELAKCILNVLKVNQDIIELPAFEGSVTRRVPNLSKLHMLTKSENLVSLEYGLNEYYSWLKNQ